jgi:Tol biopolymer transport system component
MTELEDRIRDAFQDPRWELPVWPDPMRRIRRAAARQRARLAAATLVLLAAVVTSLALLPGLITHSSRVKPSAVGTAHSPSPRASAPSVPSWASRLRGEVAYKCGNSICLMRPDGTGKRTLGATSPEWDAAWSPDGRRLAFRGYYAPYAEGDYAIYVVGANGCHLTKLTGAMNGTNPSWSPSGRQIAFAVGGINVINANGTGLRRLTSDRARSGRDRYADEDPAWSATNRIAFVRTRMGTSRGEIYTMNADGSGVAPLTHGGPGFGQPSWSPTGRQLAFVALAGHSDVIGARMAIEVANAAGTGLHRVSPPSWAGYNPTWTPGGQIVFLVQKGIRTSAYIVNPDGTGLRRLYPSLANVQESVQIGWGSAPLPRASCPRI